MLWNCDYFEMIKVTKKKNDILEYIVVCFIELVAILKQ